MARQMRPNDLTGGLNIPSGPTMAVATTLIVVGGKWANKEDLDVKLAIGVAGYVVGLALISEVSSDIAGGIGLIVLITVGFTYGHVLAYHAKLTDIKPTYAQSVGIDVRRR